MNIRAAFNTFYQENYKLLAHEYHDAQGVPIPNDLVTPKHTKTDSLDNEIQPGDLVSYYCGGSLYAASVQFLSTGYCSLIWIHHIGYSWLNQRAHRLCNMLQVFFVIINLSTALINFRAV